MKQEQKIHEQISQKMLDIEGELRTVSDTALFARDKRAKGFNGRPGSHGPPVTLLEVYCEEGSQLSLQVQAKGGRAIRFTREDGDLSTKEGKEKLWSWVKLYEPEHLWVAPECRLWGMFSRFNMGRSMTFLKKIIHEREHDKQHLVLCNDLYLHQMGEGKHFHLEQPKGSEMMDQRELDDARLGTLPAVFDMCRMGKLKLPNQEQFLQKRTTVYTTSRGLFNWLHEQTCTHDHEHAHIKGKAWIKGKWMNISSYAKAYTSTFARRVAQYLCNWRKENPLVVEEMVLGLEDHERPNLAPEALQLQKKQRLNAKQPEATMYGRAPSWAEIFRHAGYETGRVGGQEFGESHVVTKWAQMLTPEMTVKLTVACRGTDRHRIHGQAFAAETYPWRKTIMVDRHTGEIKETGPAEEWVKLSKLKQIRKTGPAKISLTLFGHKDAIVSSSAGPVPSSDGKTDERVPKSDPFAFAESEDSLMPEALDVKENPRTEVDNSQLEYERGWAPKVVPKSGPGFLALGNDVRADLRRLHNNLGHPDPGRFGKFLKERGATSEIIQGALDMQCDGCTEMQSQPKLSQPSRIHENLDFNDVIGGDGAYWTSAQGKVYHFMHFIDEATLFHVGVHSGRSFEEQVHALETAWTQWAGPCKLIYLDPAGEYATESWATYLQSEGIKVSMTAAEAHWQNGRCEVHGKIVKDMMTRMESEAPVLTEVDFRKNLRQAFAAKNSLSRVHGYTPEQCLLGKSRALPASLVSDDDASSHVLAESDSPEGQWCRDSLQRREAARKAFVQADNDSAFRRALLRRSRPGVLTFEPKDWVLYWRRSKGNNRLERGRWYGPAQVIVVEGKKVVWLSHLGRIIRASPEQLRPASLREYHKLPKDSMGNVMDETPRGRGYLELEDIPEESPVGDVAPSEAYSPSLGQSGPQTPHSTSQPDNEEFPPDSGHGTSAPSLGNEESEHGNDGVGEKLEPHEIPVPDSDDGDSFPCFGDDVEFPQNDSGVWEINLCEYDQSLSPEKEEEMVHVFLAEQVLLASTARKQKVEVQYRSLSDEDKKLFDAAKQKELKAWIDHKTVQRVANGTLKPDQIMRCRWILSWKAPEVGSVERRAKARLVVLGFEDPDLSTVPRDAPTLTKDGRQLILQLVASKRWDLLNFDISTAFLKGKGDGRALGLHAPPEMKNELQMKEGDQCLLKGGAYGRIDAPYLWYCELRKVLEELGFVACPFDGCVFSLVTQNKIGKPEVRGMLGVHVDDGIGGGDSFFKATLQKLRDRFSFGAYNEHEFDFCGVHYKQWDDGTIEMDQKGYLKGVEPIDVPKARRQEPESELNETERYHLRALCGSIQYAAVHTRPDLAAKVGQLQSCIPRGKVKDLLEVNRVLYKGKRHHVCIMVVPIRIEDLTFCAFSDASFATASNLQSRQGTLIFTTDKNLAENKRAVVCPVAWSSRKIPRVVTSTLSAEAVALSSTLDRLGFLRQFWEWVKDPSVDWTCPDKILKEAPRCNAVTDCKSVYDIASKQAPPQCSEHRTLLECLSIRERLQENISLRWIATQAMLADSLTKSMDASLLRECLRTGKYSLFDETEVLKQRANRREKLKWLHGE